MLKKIKIAGRPAAVFPLISAVIILTLIYSVTRTDNGNTLLSKASPEPVRLACSRTVLGAPIQLAYHLGFFESEDLDIKLDDRFRSGKEALESMLAGESDISTTATIPVTKNSFTRNDFSVFTTFTNTYRGVKIIVRGDSIKKPGDFRNKNVGLVQGTISQMMFFSYLAMNKISADEMNLKYYPGPELSGAIIRGELDAIAIWEPYVTRTLQVLGKNGRELPSTRVYRMAINLAVMNDFASKNKRVLVKILKALNRTIAYMKKNPEESKAMLSRLFSMDRGIVDSSWNEYTFDLCLDQILVITMENEAKWLIYFNYTDKTTYPNFLDYIMTEPLSSVDPASVTVMK